jgi:hypothetical protein
MFLLDSVLLQTAPIDPPAPRRSKRSNVDDENIRPEANIRQEAPPGSQNSLLVNLGDNRSNDSISGLDRPIPETEIVNTTRQRIRMVRNVGGWISPDFSNDLDRSWLENVTPSKPFNVCNYVPQVGDTVLYVHDFYFRLLLYQSPFSLLTFYVTEI